MRNRESGEKHKRLEGGRATEGREYVTSIKSGLLGEGVRRYNFSERALLAATQFASGDKALARRFHCFPGSEVFMCNRYSGGEDTTGMPS